jgi:RNA polymerase sigma-70 factor (ECF subfamily)
MVAEILMNRDANPVNRGPNDASKLSDGDPSRCCRLEQYYSYVNFLVRQSFPPHLAAKVERRDVVQQVLLKVLESDPDFGGRSEGERLSFLRKTYVSVVSDSVRYFDRGKRKGMLKQSLSESAARLEKWLAAVQSSPSQRASKHEQLLRLAHAIAELPENQRRAVELHHLKKHSLAETAEAMGISPQAAAGLLRRGLASLRDGLCEGEDSPR